MNYELHDKFISEGKFEISLTIDDVDFFIDGNIHQHEGEYSHETATTPAYQDVDYTVEMCEIIGYADDGGRQINVFDYVSFEILQNICEEVVL